MAKSEHAAQRLKHGLVRAPGAAQRVLVRWARSCWLTAAAALVLLVWAWGFGGQAMSPNWQDRTFYQHDLGPAVMFACGHGLRRAPDVPTLQAFLHLERPTLDCAHTTTAAPDARLNAFQGAHRYLLLSLGLAWQQQGVDWRVADRLVVGLYALSVVLGFLLLRVFLPLAWSVAGAWLYATAGTHLMFLDSLRDYAKAPFVLAVLAGLAWLLKERRPPSQVLLVALLTGCALGVGLGFRMDLLIFMPFAAGMLWVFYPATLRAAWRERLLASGVLLAGAYACAYPVLSALAQGSNTAHVILLGLSQPFNDVLGLASPDHQLSPYYHDFYQLLQIETLARLLGHEQTLEFASADYEHFGYCLLGQYAQYFPADLWMRVLAALIEGVGYPYGLRIGLEGAVAQATVGLGVAALAWRSPRVGWAFLLAAVFLFAYPVLQFNLRHFFQLSIVVILCAGLLAHGICLALWRAALRRPAAGSGHRVPTARFMAGALLVMTLPLLVWAVLWLVQRSMQAQLLHAARALPVLWITEGRDPTPNLLTTDRLGAWWSERRERYPFVDDDNERTGYYWVFDLDPAKPGCSTDLFQLALFYRASSEYYDFSRPMSHTMGRSARLFVPAVEVRTRIGTARESASLASLLVNDASWPCVQRVGVAEPQPSFPWFIELAAPLSEEPSRLAAVLPQALSAPKAPHWTLAAAPAQGAAAGLYLARGTLDPLTLSATAVLGGDAVVLTPGGLRMRSPAADRYSYLVRTEAIAVGSSDVLSVSGVLEQGGVTVGLVKDAAWAHQIVVSQPGTFELFFSPEPGKYHLVIANHVPLAGAVNAFEVNRLGWLRRQP